MALQGNPWVCSCENVWLGAWLRRWMRETLQLHTSVVERGQNIQSIVRTIQCTAPSSDTMPLVELDIDTKCFKAAMTSSGAAEARTLTSLIVVMAAILVGWPS